MLTLAGAPLVAERPLLGRFTAVELQPLAICSGARSTVIAVVDVALSHVGDRAWARPKP